MNYEPKQNFGTLGLVGTGSGGHSVAASYTELKLFTQAWFTGFCVFASLYGTPSLWLNNLVLILWFSEFKHLWCFTSHNNNWYWFIPFWNVMYQVRYMLRKKCHLYWSSIIKLYGLKTTTRMSIESYCLVFEEEKNVTKILQRLCME